MGIEFLHTSDWHLGRTLYGRSRYDEFSAFLDWLVDLIEKEQVDAVLVAGTRSQVCRHVVITAGNHDFPSFLDAPKALLRTLDVHVVGFPGDDATDEVIVLRDRKGKAEDVVCAVPHLRDRDIRTVGPVESMERRIAS